MQINCLLIAPQGLAPHFPRGLMYIASYLNANGYPAAVLPLSYYCNSNDKDNARHIILDHIRNLKPKVVGVSNIWHNNYNACIEILKICKEADGDIVTVIGGPHATYQDREALSSAYVDVVVRGEGEWTMLDLLRSLEEMKSLDDISGITFKKNGRIIKNPDRPLGNLNELPQIDYQLLPLDYVKKASIYGLSSRGCSYKCSYCIDSIFWNKVRHFPASSVVDEMETLSEKYDNQFRGFYDSMISADSKYLIDLCAEIRDRGIKLPSKFFVQLRADRISEEGVKAMKKAGISHVCMGVESASHKVLKMMNRPLYTDKITAACRLLRNHGIDIKTYWIVGHPGDDPSESMVTYRYFKYLVENDLTQSALVSMFVPYPGTCFFEDPEKYDMEIINHDLNNLRRWIGKPNHQLKNFSAEEIELVYKRFHKLQMALGKYNHFNIRNYKLLQNR